MALPVDLEELKARTLRIMTRVAKENQIRMEDDVVRTMGLLVERLKGTIQERVDEGKLDYQSWNSHIEKICSAMARVIKEQKLKSINGSQVIRLFEHVYAIYPYD